MIDWYQFILAQYFIIMMDCAKSGVSEIKWAYRQAKIQDNLLQQTIGWFFYCGEINLKQEACIYKVFKQVFYHFICNEMYKKKKKSVK